MSMPNHLILVRHGQSEGNVAATKYWAGDESAYTEDYVNTPGRMWRLTEQGRAQAAVAGAWLRGLLNELRVDWTYPSQMHERFYVSPYARTMETAALLDVKSALGLNQSVEWMVNRTIRERDWGDIETIPRRLFLESEQYKLSAQKLAMDPMYWRPPGGESFADVAEHRVRNFLDTLHREAEQQTVVAVSHGEFIRATQAVLERISDQTYLDWNKDRALRLRNCEIVHYSRIVPAGWGGAGMDCDHLAWVRRAYPVQDTKTGDWSMEIGQWNQIVFKRYANEDLLALAGRTAPAENWSDQ